MDRDAKGQMIIGDIVFLAILGILAILWMAVFICVVVEESIAGPVVNSQVSCVQGLLGGAAEEKFVSQAQVERELNAYLESKSGQERVADLWFKYLATKGTPSVNTTARDMAASVYATMFQGRNAKLTVKEKQGAAEEVVPPDTCPAAPAEAPRAFRNVPLPSDVGTIKLVIC